MDASPASNSARRELPDFAQDAISNDLEMRQGIKAIEGLVRNCKPGEVVMLSPHMSQQLVQYMNARQQWSGHIARIYWGVSPTALESIADQVRTRTIALVAEITANMPDGAITPSADVATNAVTLAVTGKRNKINVATHQSGGPMTTPVPDETPRRWVRIAAGVVIGLVTIAGVFFALMQAQGWKF